MMNKNGLEIERKFLISFPDEEFLKGIEGCSRVEIDQTYLNDRRRIRRWCENKKTTYIVTFKEKINELTRIEKESEISKAEYDSLMELSDKSRQTISKVRYRFPFDKKLIEIDIFDFWDDRAFLEIELLSEDEPFSIPPFIEVIKEVSFDKRYRNSALAAEIPFEEI